MAIKFCEYRLQLILGDRPGVLKLLCGVQWRFPSSKAGVHGGFRFRRVTPGVVHQARDTKRGTPGVVHLHVSQTQQTGDLVFSLRATPGSLDSHLLLHFSTLSMFCQVSACGAGRPLATKAGHLRQAPGSCMQDTVRIVREKLSLPSSGTLSVMKVEHTYTYLSPFLTSIREITVYRGLSMALRKKEEEWGGWSIGITPVSTIDGYFRIVAADRKFGRVYTPVDTSDK
ncbi:hypothetical protein RRG08_015419 [Elysia crispata]|uniref:Uncharacterized protein n=1 Tax=Elysia crispata TaxID=231223 RepID=A0AAE0YHB3_9GAST|nr:hypothetical protein RRG08_015419 [Elysia crispata]